MAWGGAAGARLHARRGHLQMPDYVVGRNAPPGGNDAGAGAWCSAPQTAEFLVYKRGLQFALDTRALDLSIGPDAVAHMRHFLNNTGNDHHLDMAALMSKSTQLRQRADEELALAKAFAMTLTTGTHAISSSRRGHGYFRQSEDANLYFAVGGYAFWGQGSVRVPDYAASSHYTLDFEFHFFDRYNWDSGKSVSIAGMKITDDFMQTFHRQCYAREFNIKGVLRQRVEWQAGSSPVVAQKKPITTAR
jgi:hypothetical protein